MDYLVTGGAGFIGSNVVTYLVEKGASVRVLDSCLTGHRSNLQHVADAIDFVDGDICDLTTARGATDGVRSVLHLAARPSVARSVEDPLSSDDVNIRGTLNMLVASRDAGVERFVFSSSSSVYGNTVELPKHEGMAPCPLSPYALQKLTGEHYCRIFHELYGLNAYALRYFNVFGPRQDPASDYAAVIPSFISSVLNGQSPRIHGDGGQTRDFTYVEDVVRAIECCCNGSTEGAGGVFNVAWGRRTSVLELAQAIIELSSRDDLEPVHEGTRAGDVRHSQADSTRARAILGWQPAVTFEDGLERTIEWYREKGAI